MRKSKKFGAPTGWVRGVGNLPPATYAALTAPGLQRDRGTAFIWGLWRPVPVRHRAKQAQIRNELYLSMDEFWGSGRTLERSRWAQPPEPSLSR